MVLDIEKTTNKIIHSRVTLVSSSIYMGSRLAPATLTRFLVCISKSEDQGALLTLHRTRGIYVLGLLGLARWSEEDTCIGERVVGSSVYVAVHLLPSVPSMIQFKYLCI